ncbi:homoserine dehydrogenase [Aquincola sp. S2]|uniref:Homoserine dehydrogenase n=1 Tax=Pseudaquabacterium terrae TaxID=2732868 RepID=A0ABX2EFU4_9BURK|nr:homoserine dehydrogenase [Aquabacterium terrae]NRF67466.1 homoserine dehydrogenase [Aquabacterium terrae]
MPPSHVPGAPSPARPPMRVGLLGSGVVGSGTCRVLERNRALIRARAGRDITLTMLAARNLPRARQLVGPEVEVVDDAMRVVRHPLIDVVVEVIGGCTVARELVLQAIAHGKHVVTANKALLALHGDEIFAAARAQGVMVAFEGAVAVSIPIVKALREGLTANRIEWVAGIVNGTSNYILTEMRDKGVAFAAALAEAQRLGYAEADPRFDVEGIDAGHKLALLASMAFGMPLRFDAMHIEGIGALQAADFRHAEQLGYRIKLLGVARRQAAGIELRVHPALVPARSLMAGVDGSMNAVMVKGDAAGLTMYYGAGAGSEQTASAVIADLVDVARLADAEPAQRAPALAFPPEAQSAWAVLPLAELVTRHYLRVPVCDGDAVLDDVLDVLARHGITIDTHRDAISGAGGRELLFVTQDAQEATMCAAITALQALRCVRAAAVRLRVEMLA